MNAINNIPVMINKQVIMYKWLMMTQRFIKVKCCYEEAYLPHYLSYAVWGISLVPSQKPAIQ